MKTRNLTILGLALLMAFASIADAQPGSRGFRGPGRGDCPNPMQGRLCDMLDLTEDQQVVIDEIQTQSRAKGLETRKQMVRLQNELQGLMLQDAPDASDVTKLVNSIGDLRTDQRVRRMETRLAVRALLTDEQRDQMITMQGAKGQGRGGRHGAPGMRAQRGRCDNDGRFGGRDGTGPKGRF